MRPLKIGRALAWRGLEVRPIGGFMFVSVWVAAFALSILQSQAEMLDRAREQICSGNQDFTFTVNGFGYISASNANANEVARAKERVMSSYRYEALRELVESPSASHTDLATWRFDGSLSGVAVGINGGMFSLHGITQQTITQATAFYNNCSDYLLPTSTCDKYSKKCWSTQILRDASQISSVTTCQDVAIHCGQDTTLGLRTRQYCPITCKCHLVHSENILWNPQSGCSAKCLDIVYVTHQHFPCTDALVGSSELKSYASALRNVALSYPEEYKIIFDAYADLLEAKGCSAAHEAIPRIGIDLCASSNAASYKPITYVCPETCLCNKWPIPAANLMCPRTCLRLALSTEVGAHHSENLSNASPFETAFINALAL